MKMKTVLGCLMAMGMVLGGGWSAFGNIITAPSGVTLGDVDDNPLYLTTSIDAYNGNPTTDSSAMFYVDCGFSRSVTAFTLTNTGQSFFEASYYNVGEFTIYAALTGSGTFDPADSASYDLTTELFSGTATTELTLWGALSRTATLSTPQVGRYFLVEVKSNYMGALDSSNALDHASFADFTPVPEPMGLLMMGLGVVGVIRRR